VRFLNIFKAKESQVDNISVSDSERTEILRNKMQVVGSSFRITEVVIVFKTDEKAKIIRLDPRQTLTIDLLKGSFK
jgi:hypothetical protein